MKAMIRWTTFVLLIAFSLPLAGCRQVVSAEASDTKPVTIERLNNPREPTRETLTPDAVKRLAIQTAPIRPVQVTTGNRMAIPYSAILYDNQGNTWVYISTKPQTYVRHQVTVEDINSDTAILSDGTLSENTQVVTRGAEELFGAEFEFEEE